MKITNKHIQELTKIYADLEALNRESSDLYLNAKDTGKDNKVTIKRDGKEVEVTEGALWEEIRYIGKKSEGYEILKAKYPKVFEVSEKQNKKAQELSIYCHANLNIDPIKLRLIDIINIARAVRPSLIERITNLWK